MTLNFFMEDATIIVSYYILDSNCMSVSIVETSSSAPPTIQYGNMCRVRPENYNSQIFDAVFSKETTGKKRGQGSPGHCNG